MKFITKQPLEIVNVLQDELIDRYADKLGEEVLVWPLWHKVIYYLKSQYILWSCGWSGNAYDKTIWDWSEEHKERS